MKKVLLIGSEKNWHSEDLQRASQGRCILEAGSFGSLQSTLGGRGVSSSRAPIDTEHDRVIVRSMPAGSLEQIIFRMDALGVWYSRGVPIFNPPRALEIAIDKYLCLAKLEAAGLPVPATVACQTFDEAISAFFSLNEHVVCKPLFGGEGRSLIRIDREDLAERVFRWLAKSGSVIYLQEFIDHGGSDFRLLVVGDEVIGMKRTNASDWRTNVARGANCAAHQPTSEEIELALAAVNTIGAKLAGVDLVRDQTGQPYLLEVNAVPGWKAISTVCAIDVAARFIELVVNEESVTPAAGISSW